MNVQELATAHIEKIAAKASFPEQSTPGDGCAMGEISSTKAIAAILTWEIPKYRKQIYPDYIAMARSFNVPCERCMYKKDLRAAMQRMLDFDEPFVLDVIVPYTEHVLPFIPAGQTVADMIWKP
jgi:acetolactate synthase-1/2/3 large subunit